MRSIRRKGEMLLIFDCDGVLIDSERILNAVLQRCLAGVGLQLSLNETIRRFTGISTKECLTLAQEMLGKPLDFDGLTKEFDRQGEVRFRQEIKAVPGVAEALSRLPHEKCVASSSSREHVRLGLDLTGLLSHFDQRIFTASEVRYGKPAPDLFLYAAAQMGAIPSECVVIEDSIPGVKAAVAANMRVLGFVDLTSEEELKAAGAETFRSMGDLPKLIAKVGV